MNVPPTKQTTDVVVIGCGAGGGVIAKELGEAGLAVVVLEAGRRYDPTTDYPTNKVDFETSARAFSMPRTIAEIAIRHPEEPRFRTIA